LTQEFFSWDKNFSWHKKISWHKIFFLAQEYFFAVRLFLQEKILATRKNVDFLFIYQEKFSRYQNSRVGEYGNSEELPYGKKNVYQIT